MTIFDQLRISDDGQSLFIDAHVNQADYFEDVYLKKITICTEDQVSELNPESYGENYIYQEDIPEPAAIIEPVQYYNKVQVLSSPLMEYKEIPSEATEKNGWYLDLTNSLQISNDRTLSLVLSGKFNWHSDSSTGKKLIITNGNFVPSTDSPTIDNPNVLGVVGGKKLQKDGHTVWVFKSKEGVGIGDNEGVYLYLYETDGYDVMEFRVLNGDDGCLGDGNFLHFLYQVWYPTDVTPSHPREVHLVLSKKDFDNAYNNTFDGHAIDGTKPIATRGFGNNDLSHNMFFVYIECDGTPAPSTPCTLDEMTLGVTFDYGVMFQKAMNYTKELGNDCQVSQEFTDFILNYDALKLALETEHWVPAIGFWKRHTQSSSFGHSGNYGTKGCGCHG